MGRGTAAVVYRIRHAQLNTVHALKVLHDADPDLARRLLVEGRIQASLVHPHLVAVTDVLDVQGRPALLLEHVDGPSLASFLAQVELPLPERETLFRQVVAGVAHAHRAGVVHRDLKPGNVLVEAREDGLCARVADFGVAKLLAADADTLSTRTGQLLGTPAYMAPEQLAGQPSGPAADVWALGVLGFEMACGQRPFAGTERSQVRDAILRGAAPLAAIAPELSERWRRALQGALCRDPTRRIPDASVLLGVLDGEPWSVEVEGAGRRVGDFELIEPIGSGAAGVVFRARQLGLDRDVALKLIPRSSPPDVEAEARFLREVRALSRVDHPNVVRILAHGQTDTELFFAMELVRGSDLTQVAPRLPREELVVLFAGVADGLQALHDAAVIHRDVKPSNLLLTEAGDRILVADLGLARLTDSQAPLTRHDVRVLGTLRYMPPEQLQRSLLQVDHRVDVYALGVTLTELCTGVPFFDGDSEERLIQQVLFEDPPTARDRDPDVPGGLDLVLQHATAKRPAERYGSAAELAADLRALARGDAPSVRRLGRLGRLRRWMRRHPLAVAILGTALATALSTVSGVSVLLASLLYLDRQVDKHYLDVVPRNGGYAGNGWLGTWKVPNRRHVRVTYEDGLPMRLEHRWDGRSDAGGEPQILEQTFDRFGRVLRVVFLDADGVEQHTELVSWSEDERGRAVARRRFVAPDGMPIPDPDLGVSVVEEILDARGFVAQRRHLDEAGRPVPDRSGTYGVRQTRDRWGRLTERAWLGPEGQSIRNASGVAIVRRRWLGPSHFGPGEERVYGPDGRPTHDADGIHLTMERHSFWPLTLGNIQESWNPLATTSTFDVDGRAVGDRLGIAVWRVRSWAEVPTVRTFDALGRPAPGREGVPVIEPRSDSRRRLNAEGEPMVGDDGFAEWRQETLGDGAVRKTFHGPDGSLVRRSDDGAAGYLDTTGRRTCLGLDLQPSPCRAGWATREHVDDDVHGWSRVQYLDTEGQLTWHLGEQLAAKELKRDGRGRILTFLRSAPDGSLAEAPGRPAHDQRTFDVAGNVVERHVLDAEGDPIMGLDGYHRVEIDYDRGGRELGARFFDTEDRLVVPTHRGYATMVRRRDRFGRILEERYYDADDEPTVVTGCARRQWARDPWGRVVRAECSDPTGAPAPGLDGAARVEYVRDSFGNVLEERRDGHVWQHRYDHRHRRVRTTTDAAGERSVVERVYDDANQLVEERTPTQHVRFEHDAFHRVEREIRDPGPTISRRYDAMGLLVEERSDPPSPWAVHRLQRDVYGRVTEERWLDESGEGIDGPDGWARLHRSYDERGEVVGESSESDP